MPPSGRATRVKSSAAAPSRSSPGIRFDNTDECGEGGALALFYLCVGIVGAGYTFNLRERELETLLEAPTANTATEMLHTGRQGGEPPVDSRTFSQSAILRTPATERRSAPRATLPASSL